MQYRCALLAVSDMQKSLKFYKDLLKQEVEYDFGENISFKGGFAIHLDTHFEKLIGQNIIKKSHSTELYFEDDAVKEIRDLLLQSGCELVHDLREQPWRQLVFRVYDPDGHIIEIGETLEHLCYRLHTEGLEQEEITKISNMSIDFVNASIRQFVS